MPYPDYSGGATGYYQSDPLVDFPQSSTRGGGGTHPWKVTIINDPVFPETGDPSAEISIKGNIVDQILGLTQLELTGWSDEDGWSGAVNNTGVVCLKYTYGSDGPPVVDPVITLEFQSDDDYKAFDFTLDPFKVTASRYPLALIIDNPDPPDEPTPADAYIVKQLCRNHLAKTIICYNGRSLTSFTPI